MSASESRQQRLALPLLQKNGRNYAPWREAVSGYLQKNKATKFCMRKYCQQRKLSSSNEQRHQTLVKLEAASPVPVAQAPATPLMPAQMQLQPSPVSVTPKPKKVEPTATERFYVAKQKVYLNPEASVPDTPETEDTEALRYKVYDEIYKSLIYAPQFASGVARGDVHTLLENVHSGQKQMMLTKVAAEELLGQLTKTPAMQLQDIVQKIEYISERVNEEDAGVIEDKAKRHYYLNAVAGDEVFTDRVELLEEAISAGDTITFKQAHEKMIRHEKWMHDHKTRRKKQEHTNTHDVRFAMAAMDKRLKHIGNKHRKQANALEYRSKRDLPQLSAHEKRMRPCPYLMYRGKCAKGDKCDWSHANVKQKTQYQRKKYHKSNIGKCTYCGIRGHKESECRKKKASATNRNLRASAASTPSLQAHLAKLQMAYDFSQTGEDELCAASLLLQTNAKNVVKQKRGSGEYRELSKIVSNARDTVTNEYSEATESCNLRGEELTPKEIYLSHGSEKLHGLKVSKTNCETVQKQSEAENGLQGPHRNDAKAPNNHCKPKTRTLANASSHAKASGNVAKVMPQNLDQFHEPPQSRNKNAENRRLELLERNLTGPPKELNGLRNNCEIKTVNQVEATLDLQDTARAPAYPPEPSTTVRNGHLGHQSDSDLSFTGLTDCSSPGTHMPTGRKCAQPPAQSATQLHDFCTHHYLRQEIARMKSELLTQLREQLTKCARQRRNRKYQRALRRLEQPKTPKKWRCTPGKYKRKKTRAKNYTPPSIKQMKAHTPNPYLGWRQGWDYFYINENEVVAQNDDLLVSKRLVWDDQVTAWKTAPPVNTPGHTHALTPRKASIDLPARTRTRAHTHNDHLQLLYTPIGHEMHDTITSPVSAPPVRKHLSPTKQRPNDQLSKTNEGTAKHQLLAMMANKINQLETIVELKQKGYHVFLLDSGANRIFASPPTFNDLTRGQIVESDDSKVTTATGAQAKTTARAITNLYIDGCVCKNVPLVELSGHPNAQNLLAVSALTSLGYRVVFEKHIATVYDKEGNLAFEAHRAGGVYITLVRRHSAIDVPSKENHYLAMAITTALEQQDVWDSLDRPLAYIARSFSRGLSISQMVHAKSGHANVNSGPLRTYIRQTYGIHTPKLQHRCKVCDMTKAHRLPHRRDTGRRAMVTEPGKEIHIDAFSMPIYGIDGSKYGAVMWDRGATTYYAITAHDKRALAHKIHTKLKALQKDGLNLIVLGKDTTPLPVSNVHGDQGTDIRIIGKNNPLTVWAERNGITVTTSSAYEPAENPYAENAVKIALEGEEAVRHAAGLPRKYWPYAFKYKADTHMMLPNKSADGDKQYNTPAERLTKKTIPFDTIMKMMHPFGCLSIVYIPRHLRPHTHLELKGWPAIFLGYSARCKGTRRSYIVQLLSTGKIVDGVYNVVFDETRFPMLTKDKPAHPDYNPLLEKEQQNIADTNPYAPLANNDEEEPGPPAPVSAEPHSPTPPTTSSLTTTPADTIDLTNMPDSPDEMPPLEQMEPQMDEYKHDLDTQLHQAVLQPDPTPDPTNDPTANGPRRSTRTVATSSAGLESLAYMTSPNRAMQATLQPTTPNVLLAPSTRKQMLKSPDKDKYIQAELEHIEKLKTLNVFDIVPRQQAKNIITSRWVYDVTINAFTPDPTYRARVTARGFTQEYGIDYEDTSSPTVSLDTFRALEAWALKHQWPIRAQFDVRSAYYHAIAKYTQYLEIPEGHVKPGQEGMVWKLNKSMPGTKDAGHNWWKDFRDFLTTECHMKVSKADPALYYSKQGTHSVFIATHVDDAAVWATHNHIYQTLLKRVRAKFKIKEAELLNTYVGIHSTVTNGAIMMRQPQLIAKAAEAIGVTPVASLPPRPALLRPTGDLLPKDCVPQGDPRRKELDKLPYVRPLAIVAYIAR